MDICNKSRERNSMADQISGDTEYVTDICYRYSSVMSDTDLYIMPSIH